MDSETIGSCPETVRLMPGHVTVSNDWRLLLRVTSGYRGRCTVRPVEALRVTASVSSMYL